MKLCVDCVHFNNDSMGGEHGKCNKVWKTPPRINPVNGRLEEGDRWYAATQRCAAGSCGPSGRLWQPLIPVIIVKENNLEPKRPNTPNIIKRACLRLLRLLRN